MKKAIQAELEMAISFQKSVVVFLACGKAVAQMCKSLLVWRQGVQHLRIRGEGLNVDIPRESTIACLSATLSYGNYELQTFQTTRAQAARRFQELRRVLRTNGALALRHRDRLHKAVTWPIQQ
eukprot:s3154_g2.t1